jgi:hypothetical protein
LAECEAALAEKSAEAGRLSDNLVDYGQLKTNASEDISLKAQMSAELQETRARLAESSKQLKVLAVAEDGVGGEDGSRVLPLMLLETIRINAAKSVLAEQAMVALQYVLSSDRHSDAELIRRRNGVAMILDCMGMHEGNADLQSAACGLLWKLAFADPPVREIIVKAEGIARIMGSMQHHTDHPRLHYNACGALRQVLVTAPKTFADASQIAGVSRAETQLPPLTPSGERRRPSQHGGRSGSRGGVHPSQMPMGAPPRMLLQGRGGGSGSRSGLRGVSSNPQLRQHNPLDGTAGRAQGTPGGAGSRPATVALTSSRRAERESEEVRPAAREDISTQALKLTLRSMIDHEHTVLVQEYGCGTLYNLSLAHPGVIRNKLAADGGVPLVLRAMRNHPMAPGLQLNACALLKELAELPPCLKQLDAGGARELLDAAMANHQLNDDLLARATEALRYLPDVEGGDEK